MSSIIGPVTPAKIALALGAIGVGAVTGGVIAGRRDADIGTGALIGGLSAAAGIALLVGGAHVWERMAGARGSAGAGVFHLNGFGSGKAIASSAVAAKAPVASTLATAVRPISAAQLAEVPTAYSLFHAAATATPIATTISTLGRTPVLPVPAVVRSGSTFVDALRVFMR